MFCFLIEYMFQIGNITIYTSLTFENKFTKVPFLSVSPILTLSVYWAIRTAQLFEHDLNFCAQKSSNFFTRTVIFLAICSIFFSIYHRQKRQFFMVNAPKLLVKSPLAIAQ